MALGPLAVLALLRLRDGPTPAAYALFGAVLGLGLLTRYNYAIFAVALVGAALSTPDWRSLLLRRRALLALAIVAVMLIPHLVWVAQNWSILSAEVEGQIIGPEAPAYARRVLDGLGRLAEASVSILIAPLGIMAAVFLPGAFRRLAIAGRERASGLALLRRLLLFCLGLMLLYVLAGASYVKPHHLFFLAFAPLWLIARLDAARLAPWRPRGFALGLAACAAAAALAYPFDNLADARRCGACEEFQPMADYASALRAAGFERGTILALSRRQDFPTAALRAFFPEARVTASDYRVYAPPPNAVPGACLLVWSGGTEWPPAWDGVGQPVPRLGLPLPPDAVIGRAEGRVSLSGRDARGMRFALVRDGLGDCR